MGREESDLYGLPLDEFIAARTALEKRLRKEGDRERAAAVKRLPKPTVAAWGVNQASRSQPNARRELLAAAEELRKVQERLIAGEASASELEAAASRQRASIEALTDAAAGLLSTQGESLSETTLGRVRDTFAAVAADPELAELVEAGTLDRERRAAGLGLGGLAAPVEDDDAEAASGGKRPRGGKAGGRKPGGRKAGAGKARGAKGRGKGAERGVSRAEDERAGRAEEVRAARERVRGAKAAARDAKKRLAGAERAAGSAAEALAKAERKVKEAADALAKAERKREEARVGAESARRELDSARHASEEAAGEREAAEEELRRLGAS